MLGGTVNTFFVTGAVIGALAYHEARQASVEALNISFVVSTRQDSAIGGNAFTPSRLQASGAQMLPEERFRQLHQPMTAKRAEVQGARADVVDGRRGQPAPDVGRHPGRAIPERPDGLRHQQPARRPRPLYMCGAKVLQNIPIGPVAGTAFNITTISYNGSLDIGLAIDPRAVEDPADLRRCMADGYAELMAAGGVATRGLIVAEPDVGAARGSGHRGGRSRTPSSGSPRSGAAPGDKPA